MRRPLAAGLTMLIMTLMTGVALRRPAPPSVPAAAAAASPAPLNGDSPLRKARFAGASDRIERLIASARAGDVAAYLDAFGGVLRSRLEQEAHELGWADFGARLRQSAQARKSHAIFAAEPDPAAQDGACITVESAYRDRIERQTYHVELAGGQWVVTDVEAAREHVPKNALGALATYEEPEGVPVPADFAH